MRMHRSEFLSQTSVKFWLDSLNGGEPTKPFTTQYNWVGCLERYCEWISKTPDELIAERKEALKSDDERVKHQAEIDVKRYLNYLMKQKHLAPSTVRNYFMGIRNFYKRNYLELTFFRSDAPKTHTVREGARAASKEDIRKMLEVSNPRVKALILFIKDCGLAEADLVKLKLKDLGVKEVSDIFSLQAPVPLVVHRKKTGRRTVTFIGEEALKALQVTLKIRQVGTPEIRIIRRGKEEEKKGVPPEKLTLESPVFRSYHKMLTNKSEPKHLTALAISTIIRERAKVAGIWQHGFGAHALRRFFQTSLETSGMQSNWTKKMMGHTLGGSEAPYSRPEISVLRAAYGKAYPYLTISEHTEQKSRVENLEAQMEALIMNGKRKDQEITELRKAKETLALNGQQKTSQLEQVQQQLTKVEVDNKELKKDITQINSILEKIKQKVEEL